MALVLDGIAPLLHVTDIARSVAFYRDILDFELVATAPRGAAHYDWCMLVHGELAIMLSVESTARAASSDATSRVSLYFSCNDVDALHRLVEARGLLVAAPVVTQTGMRQLWLVDPDGVELCFQHPA